MEQLIKDLKLQIKEALNLEELSLEDFDADAPLFGDEGIGLDSIDVLEIIVLLEKEYGIRLANPQEGKAIFKSVRTIAEYVQANRKK
jgi:acyl carrier protein